jgi:hypothetical protein
VGLRAGLDTEARGKVICLCRASNPRSSSLQPDTILTELPQLLVDVTTVLKYDLTFSRR